MKKFFIALAVLLLASCATVSQEQMFQMACNSVTTSVKVLTGYKAAGSLSADQIARVDEWKPISKAVCSGSSEGGLQTIIDISNGMLSIEKDLK